MKINLFRKNLTLNVLIIFSLVWLNVSTSRAQKLPFKATTGKHHKVPVSTVLDDVVGYDETGIYVVRHRVFGVFVYVLDHFNHDLNLTKSFTLDIKTNGKSERFEKILQLNNVLHLFTSYKNSSTGLVDLLVRKIDKKSLMPEKQASKLFSTESEGREWGSGYFSFSPSPDSSHLLIYRDLPQDAGAHEQVTCYVFDAGIKERWHQTITMTSKDKLFDLRTSRVDSKGNVYLLGRLYKGSRKEKKKGDPNYEYRVLMYTAGNDKGREYVMSSPDKFLIDMKMQIDKHDNVVCAGYYSEHSTQGVRGIFYMTIDGTTHEVKRQDAKEFSFDVLTRGMSAARAERTERQEERGKDVDLKGYDLDHLILKDDGSALLVGEQLSVVSKKDTYRLNGQLVTNEYTEYHFKGILVVSVSSASEINWVTRVPKWEISQSIHDYYCSYELALVKNNLYLLFNENSRNIGGGVSKPWFHSKKISVACIVEVNGQGEQSRDYLLSTFGSGMMMVATSGRQISDDEMILLCRRKKKQQFTRLSFY